MCVFDKWLLNVSTQEAHNMEPSPLFSVLLCYCCSGGMRAAYEVLSSSQPVLEADGVTFGRHREVVQELSLSSRGPINRWVVGE